jgi:hypothetical protein
MHSRSLTPLSRYDLRLLPWAGTAARLRDTDADKDQHSAVSSTDGLAYVFLPLPVHTGLPVHVNGFFEVGSSGYQCFFLYESLACSNVPSHACCLLGNKQKHFTIS